MGLEPEDLMRLQPADVHRGQRSFTPREQAGHMTASTPSISVNFLLARRGPSTHGLLIDRQHHGMGGRVDVEADDVAQLRHEVRVAGELEVPQAMGRKPVRPPNALYRRDADPGGLGHGGSRPVRCLVGRLGDGERQDPVDDLLPERRHAGRPRIHWR